jgi:hypothetical protein
MSLSLTLGETHTFDTDPRWQMPKMRDMIRFAEARMISSAFSTLGSCLTGVEDSSSTRNGSFSCLFTIWLYPRYKRNGLRFAITAYSYTIMGSACDSHEGSSNALIVSRNMPSSTCPGLAGSVCAINKVGSCSSQNDSSRAWLFQIEWQTPSNVALGSWLVMRIDFVMSKRPVIICVLSGSSFFGTVRFGLRRGGRPSAMQR